VERDEHTFEPYLDHRLECSNGMKDVETGSSARPVTNHALDVNAGFYSRSSSMMCFREASISHHVLDGSMIGTLAICWPRNDSACWSTRRVSPHHDAIGSLSSNGRGCTVYIFDMFSCSVGLEIFSQYHL
jgi:hypothetical protein